MPNGVKKTGASKHANGQRQKLSEEWQKKLEEQEQAHRLVCEGKDAEMKRLKDKVLEMTANTKTPDEEQEEKDKQKILRHIKKLEDFIAEHDTRSTTDWGGVLGSLEAYRKAMREICEVCDTDENNLVEDIVDVAPYIKSLLERNASLKVRGERGRRFGPLMEVVERLVDRNGENVEDLLKTLIRVGIAQTAMEDEDDLLFSDAKSHEWGGSVCPVTA